MPRDSDPGPRPDTESAFTMARYFVKQAYEGKGPDLDFPTDSATGRVTPLAPDYYKVTGYVIRDDHFNPPTRILWTAKVRKGRGDNWRLENLTSE